MRRSWVVLLLMASFVSVAWAQPVRLVPDDPTDLPDGGPTTFFVPWSIVENDAAAYTQQATLSASPVGIKIDAAWEIFKDNFIMSVEDASVLGGTTYRRSDFLRWNTTSNSFSLERTQESAGIPGGSNIDALFRDPRTRHLAISFDVPTTIGAQTYQPADLAQYDFSGNTWVGLFFDASANGIPDSANLTAAQARGTAPTGNTRFVFSLDAPTVIGVTTYLPGDLLLWDGSSISLFQSLSGWPISSHVNALSFRGAPGITPPTVKIEKVSASILRLHWNASSCSGLEHHVIYQGSLASLPAYDHSSIDCFDNGTQLQEDIATPASNSYFIVVPTSQLEEGSYGTDTLGDGVGPEGQRPVGSSRCESVQNLDQC